MKVKKTIIAALIMLIMLAVTGCGKKKIDVTESLQVSFDGYNGYGKAEILNAYAWENEAFEAAGISSIDGFDTLGNALNIEMAVSYNIEPDSNLSNGDTVVVKTVIDEAALENYDFKLIAGSEKTFTVEDLPELKEVDPFENVEVIYEGISSNARATVVQGGTIPYPMDFYYKVEPDNGLKNGDVITVRISNSDPEREAIEAGYRLTGLEKDFTVSGLSHYAEKLAEIPSDAIDQMKKHTENIIEKNWEDQNKRGQLWSKDLVYTIKDMDYLGNYFLVSKNPDQLLFDTNMCWFVFKIELTGKEDFSYYYAMGYYGILVSEDGSCSYDFDNNKIAEDIVSRGLMMFPGSESLDEILNTCVTQNLADYSYESTIIEN